MEGEAVPHAAQHLGDVGGGDPGPGSIFGAKSGNKGSFEQKIEEKP